MLDVESVAYEKCDVHGLRVGRWGLGGAEARGAEGRGLFAGEEAGEEGFFLGGGGCGGVGVAGGWVVGADCGEAAVDVGPGGDAEEVAVVDVEVGGDFTGGGGEWEGCPGGVGACGCDWLGCGGLLAGVVGVDGEEVEPACGAPVDGFLEQTAFAHGPEDEAEVGVFALELSESGDGEGAFASDGGVAVFDDGAVEVNGEGHVS